MVAGNSLWRACVNSPIFTPVTIVPPGLSQQTKPWQADLPDQDSLSSLHKRIDGNGVARERNGQLHLTAPHSKGDAAQASSRVLAVVGTQAGDVHLLDASCGSHVGRHVPGFPGRASISAGIGVQVRPQGLGSPGVYDSLRLVVFDQRHEENARSSRVADKGNTVMSETEEGNERGTGNGKEEEKGRVEYGKHIVRMLLPQVRVGEAGMEGEGGIQFGVSRDAIALTSPADKKRDREPKQRSVEAGLAVKRAAAHVNQVQGWGPLESTDAVSFEHGDRLVYCRSDGTVGVLAVMGPAQSETSTASPGCQSETSTAPPGCQSGACAEACWNKPARAGLGAMEGAVLDGTPFVETQAGGSATRVAVLLPGEVFSSPVFFNDIVVVGCRDDHLYCLHVPGT